MPDPSLLQRLKERKLVQWAVAYLGGGVGGVQAARRVGGNSRSSNCAIQRAILVIVPSGSSSLSSSPGITGRKAASGSAGLNC